VAQDAAEAQAAVAQVAAAPRKKAVEKVFSASVALCTFLGHPPTEPLPQSKCKSLFAKYIKANSLTVTLADNPKVVCPNADMLDLCPDLKATDALHPFSYAKFLFKHMTPLEPQPAETTV
jgi:hypothetical protein